MSIPRLSQGSVLKLHALAFIGLKFIGMQHPFIQELT